MSITVEIKGYGIRQASPDDVEYLSTRLRIQDKEEIFYASGRSVASVLRSSLRVSEKCRVGLFDDEPFCIYGIRRQSELSDSGIIWLLGTDDLDRHAMKFSRNCKEQVRWMMKGFSMAENWCQEGNVKTLRWLKWLGFTVEPAKPFGRKKAMFHHFYMRSENV